MSKFQYRYIEAHQVNLVYQIDIDTKDQALWTRLLDLANPDLLEDEDEFSDEAPTDQGEWFRLLGCIDQAEFPESHEEWWTLEKGGYETCRELLDENGNPVISTE